MSKSVSKEALRRAEIVRGAPEVSIAPPVRSRSADEVGDLSTAALAANIGKGVIGPLCYGFAKWLVEQARAEGLTQLYFLSRDGWMLKQAFDLLPQELTRGLSSHYLYSSRRAVWFASLRDDTSESEFNEILAGASPYVPVADFLKRIFIEPQEFIAQIKAAGFEDETSVVETAADKEKLYALFQAIKPQIVANAASERDAYLGYLRTAGVFDNEKAGLVDVGWTGSIIKYTRALVKSVDPSIDLHGYFIGVGKQAQTKYGFTKGQCLHGYLFDFDDDSYPEILRTFFVVEKFMSPSDPSLIRMKKVSGGYEPVYKLGEQESSPLKPVVQKNALEFIHKRAHSDAIDAPFKVDAFLPALRRLLSDPDAGTAKLLSRYSYSSDFGYAGRERPIARAERTRVYLRNPLLLFKQYRRARWKEGFIAQQPLPARAALKLVKGAKLDIAFEELALRARKLH